MQQSQEMSSDAKVELAEAVDESLGNPSEAVEDSQEKDDLPEGAKKRLGMQEKRHKKELRKMQQQLEEMRTHMSRPSNNYAEDSGQSYGGEEQDDPVYRAVQKALQMQKMQEQEAKDQEKMQHVHKQYQALQDRLDNASSKYEDFDDVVRSDDAPYTDAIRDAALLVDNADEVLYRLGKDRDKLKELSKLHPLEQAREVVRLSHALSSGNNGKNQSSHSEARPLGQVKSKPMTAHGVNENTSISDIREKMKKNGKNWS